MLSDKQTEGKADQIVSKTIFSKIKLHLEIAEKYIK